MFDDDAFSLARLCDTGLSLDPQRVALFQGKRNPCDVVIQVDIKFAFGERGVAHGAGHDIEMCSRVWQPLVMQQGNVFVTGDTCGS